MGNGNGSSMYAGAEKRTEEQDRRDHLCIHEGDFGVLKSNLKNLDFQVRSNILEQKERNEIFYSKLDALSMNVVKVSNAQDLLPSKVVDILEKKKTNKLAQYSGILRNIGIILTIASIVTVAMFWLVNFVQHNAVPTP